MKCVSIVYKRPTSQNLTPQLVPVRSIKRSVDQYLQRLQEKQQQHKRMLKTQTKTFRSQLKTMQTSRHTRLIQPEMPDFINVCRMKYSTQNIFKPQANPQFSQDKKQKKFRSTFLKKKQSKNSYSLKGIKTFNQGLFYQNKHTISQNRVSTGNQNASKLVTLKRLKLAKPNTVLISVDFILNENNFWQEERIDQAAHKNWKLLQEHSNIVWLAKRQNSSKKLEKYAAEYGLRLDGVYKVTPSKKGQTLIVSLGMFEKDFRIQSDILKMKDLKKEVIVINSLKVDQIKDVKYEQFYKSFPVVKSLRCVVHFIQVDMDDKHRFNSPLKILSKENLPSPNSVTHLFAKFYKDHESNPQQIIQSYMMDLNNIEPQQEETISKEEMMQKYEVLKEQFVNYFGNHLKISMNKKLKIDETECSVQFMIGDMLKRNFNIMYGYQKECIKIKKNLQKIQSKINHHSKIPQQPSDCNTQNNSFVKSGNAFKMDYDDLIKSKLLDKEGNRQNVFMRKRQTEKQYFYKDPVFLWKK